MGEALNGKSGLDIDEEKRVIEEALRDLTRDNASQESITSAMKDLGIQRARMYGWPNTYVFTKALGEMVLGEFKQDLPLAIIRPTMVTGTYKEPFPGWVEGIRTIDSFWDLGYADMVVNVMIVAMVAHADERGGGESIYHVGSSVSNPIEFSRIQDFGYRYFTQHPWIGKDGKAVRVGKVTVLNSMASFERYMTIRYLLPLKIMGKEIFQILKEKCGNSVIFEKVTVVAGDVSCENLGVKDSHLLTRMLSEVDAVVNLAATTKFDERYDVALGINTMGPKHVLDFAKKCPKLRILLHVSTAYVSGIKEGLIAETPYKMGEALNGKSGLDIDEEKRVIEEALRDLTRDNASQESITSAMKDLGIQRARMYGWPNTYVFTKALGEMVLGEFKQDLPLAIIRPTMVTGTYKEPFPGWVEGIRTIDSLGLGYGKGKLTCFLGDPKTITDVIPADMVVNVMIVAMVAHADERGGGESIYHVGSSVSNPIEFSRIQDFGYRYFTQHPWIGKDGKAVRVGKVTVLNSMASFERYMTIRYLLPLKGKKGRNHQDGGWVFVEKILRVQPNVKKLYLLLRAADTEAALQRFNTEVTVVAGDVSCENLGVKDSHLLTRMLSEVDAVVNLAATTKFDERYDVALEFNTMGPKHEGLIAETPYKMGEALNGKSGLDIDEEKRVIEEALRDLTRDNASQESITSAMKDLGIQRGKLTCFLGDPKTITDVIPADMVGERDDSSNGGPCRRTRRRHPWIGKDGKAVRVGKVTVLNSMASFERYIDHPLLAPFEVFMVSVGRMKLRSGDVQEIPNDRSGGFGRDKIR
nr:alcohol-forming fatty acyl-CoA reductase-like [Ipomoea batatas]